jgi:CelD/BcsL family acetyltransferase involved in cellulose biosynthesis
VYADLHAGKPGDLMGEWAGLHAAQPEATPFMSPAWATAWWPRYGNGARPLTIVVRDAGEVVALAPLAMRRRGPLRTLEPVGVDPGDYWDVLARPDIRAEAVREVARELLRRAGAWDAAVLRCLPPGSGLIEALREQGARIGIDKPIPAPAIELPATFDEYLASLSSSRRQNLRRHLKRLDGGEVTLHEVSDAAELGPALDRWQAFRRAQWDSAGRDINPEHLSERFRAFVEEVVTALLPAGQAMVWEFRRDGEVVGTYVNFADPLSYFWYLGGFDPAVASLGLGKIAIGHGIRTSVEAGRRRYDFARGAEEYKYWYGAQDRELGGVVAGTGRPRSLAALAAARFVLARR